MSVKEKPPDDFYKCIKVSLKHILKHPEINTTKINDTVITANKIMIHTLQFMKLYLLDFYSKNNSLPKIDKVFINSCMKILCNEVATGRPPKKEIVELKNTLKLFQKKHYPIEELSYSYMNTILDYLTIDVLTMYENNIKLHYVEYVEKYVNFYWKKKFIIEKIRKLNITQKEKESRVNKLCNELRKIKNDILNVEEKKLKSHSSYHNWIQSQLQFILPNKSKFQKDNIRYDLQCNPQDYLPCMVYMMKQIENEGNSILNVFPLRSEISAKYIRIDTTKNLFLLILPIGSKIT